MKRWILFSLLFLASCVANAQYRDAAEQGESPFSGTRDPSTLPATKQYAAENIERRKFDQKKWREIVESRNYTDTRTRKDPKTQQSDRGEAGPRSGSRAYNGDDDDGSYEYDVEEGESINLGWLGPLGQLIFYAAIIAIIGMILVQLIRNTSFKFNAKRTDTTGINIEDLHDITQLDTEDLIQKAHHANDYKLAVRLHFLDLLKKLNENGTIVWTKDKTNRDYLSELFTKQYYFDDVRRLTLAYERIWYGEHLPTEERYHELRNEFQEVNQKFTVS